MFKFSLDSIITHMFVVLYSYNKIESVVPVHVCMFIVTIYGCTQDFIFPQEVAYPIGGEENAQYAILEMHYDNPAGISGQ